VSSGKATPEQVLAAVRIELNLLRRRLIACRNRLYRETGTYPDDPGAALQRTDFLLDDLMAGLVSPPHVNPTPRSAGARLPTEPTRIQ
jgi:hypothetical protein